MNLNRAVAATRIPEGFSVPFREEEKPAGSFMHAEYVPPAFLVRVTLLV
jgi:hypothetical protein